MFSVHSSLLYQVIYLRYEYGQSHSTLNTIFWRFWLLFLSFLPSYLDHEKSGKSTTSFNQEFIKTINILNVNKDLCGKLCTSVLFYDVTFIAAISLIVDQLWYKNEKYMARATVSFGIKIQVECNAVLLVVNYVAKIHWFWYYFLQKEIHVKIFVRFSNSALAKLNPKVQ